MNARLSPSVLCVTLMLAACGTTPLGVPDLDGGAPPDGGALVDGGPAADGGPVADGGVDGGASCAQDADCGDGRVCEASQCIAACSMQNPCQGGFTVTCDQGHCRQRCLGDGTCPGGSICESFVCVPPQCSDTQPCAGANRRCVTGRCETYTPCTSTAQCPANFTCEMQICEELPTCIGDSNCSAGEVCESGHCHSTPTCQGEADCTSAQDCVGGLCVPHVCRGNSECQSPQVCSGGACVAPANVALVFKVVILTPGGVLRPGETRPLVAIALDQNDRAVEGAAFDWASDLPAAVSVDATTGLLRGGESAGTASIRATAHGTTVVSAPVAFSNILPIASDQLRVTIIDRVTGQAVQGAKILVNGTASDVPTGTFTAPAPSGPFDVTVFHGTHDYLTVLQTTVRDLVLPLAPRSALDPAAGVTGTINLAGVSSTGPVRIGLAGLSSARILSDQDFQRLFGETFTSQVAIPGAGSFGVPLPGGLTLSAEVFMGLNVDVKSTFYATGDPGTRAAWSFGGRVDIAEVSSVFGRGGGGMGNVLRQILPLFSRFDHGVLPAVTIAALPRIVDTADINGNMDRTERVPDWAHFRTLTEAPAQPQTMRTSVEVSTLPSLDGTPVQGAVLTVGVMVPGTGLVPLGLTGAFDDSNQGHVAPVALKSAPVHSGLGVGRYVVTATAASFSGGAGMQALPTTFSASVQSFETLPTDVTLPDFVPFPVGGTYAPVTRSYRVPSIAGATLRRLVFQGDAGAWEVFAPAGNAELTGRLPSLPTGVSEDLSGGATARVEAIALTSGASLPDLLSGASAGIQGLNRLIVGYSRKKLDNP